jgi:uncharacterized secreted protein with C-terminal beta-propeller domain
MAALRRVAVMNRIPARLTVPRALGAAVLLAGVLVAVPLVSGDRASLGRNQTAHAATLKPFRSCGTVLQYFKEHAPDYLIERAGGEVWTAVDGGAGRGVPDVAAARDTAGGATEAGPPPEHSTTNVQEAGVDEPDLVKTDGGRIVAVASGRVHLIEATGGTMTRRATLPDTEARNVFLSGDRLLVFSGSPVQEFEPGLRGTGQRAVLTAYDIADLSRPQRRAALTVDGDVVDARLVGTQVRVATVSSPDVDAPSPVYTATGISAKSKAELRAAVDRSTVDDWIPTYVLRDGAGTLVSKGRLVECDDLVRPETFSGLDTVAVTSFDLGSALESRQTVGVVAGGQQLYATDVATYISSTEWSNDGQPATTSLHKFVTAPSGASRYSGSGEVPGTLLNSYAMSEHDGVLRVASTVSGRRGWASPRQVTEGVVTTLQERDGALRRLGQVGGLGREDNESIRAVRFIEERAYVVTFRQTDPLYVLDLSDAAAPQVTGELKIPGYSGYLHPIGDDLLLGVGQSGGTTGDVDPGRGSANGVQFSLFDIGDPSSPRRIDTQTYGAGAANVEFDPRAFLYWEPRDLVIAPTSLYGGNDGKEAFSGLVLLEADADGLRELGRLATTEADGTAQRSVVIGEVVYMLTDQALSAHNLSSHAEIDKLTF